MSEMTDEQVVMAAIPEAHVLGTVDGKYAIVDRVAYHLAKNVAESERSILSGVDHSSPAKAWAAARKHPRVVEWEYRYAQALKGAYARQAPENRNAQAIAEAAQKPPAADPEGGPERGPCDICHMPNACAHRGWVPPKGWKPYPPLPQPVQVAPEAPPEGVTEERLLSLRDGIWRGHNVGDEEVRSMARELLALRAAQRTLPPNIERTEHLPGGGTIQYVTDDYWFERVEKFIIAQRDPEKGPCFQSDDQDEAEFLIHALRFRALDDRAAQRGCGIYVAHVEEVPSLSNTPHEVAEEYTAEEIVQMWDALKAKYIETKAAQRGAGEGFEEFPEPPSVAHYSEYGFNRAKRKRAEEQEFEDWHSRTPIHSADAATVSIVAMERRRAWAAGRASDGAARIATDAAKEYYKQGNFVAESVCIDLARRLTEAASAGKVDAS